MYKNVIKRVCDLILALLLLVLAFIPMIIVAICIKIEDGGPIIYKSKRVGKNCKVFNVYKFRSMKVDRQELHSNLSHEQMVTKVGKVIRKTSLDELPQLINILEGDMSFVGTRPEVKKYVDKYTDEMKATLLMPAGVTSIASIKYKDEDNIISKYLSNGEKIDDIYMKRVLPEKMKYNLEYIKKFSIFKDILVCLNTIGAVIQIKKDKIEG